MLISALASWKRQLAARIQNGNARRRRRTAGRTSVGSLERLEHRTLLSAVVGTGWERIGPPGSLVFQEDVTGSFGSGDIALFSDGFESGVLGPEWTTASSTPQGRIQVSNSLGTPARSGSFHLAMDRNPAGTLNLNEAILTLDLAGQSGVSLSFWQKDVGDEETFLPSSFTGSRPGDGVAISADGVTWHTVVNFTFANSPSNVYSRFTVDLDAAAAAAGISLGDDFQIKFQQYDDFPFNTDGRTFDDILITAEAPPVDLTEAYLEAGQTLTVVAAPDNPASALTVDVYGPGDVLLGSVTADGAGETVSLQTLEIGAEGTYRIAVSGDIGGTYDLSLFRNAAVEVVDSGSGAEQEITGSFIELGSGRYAVVGQFGNQQDEGEEEPVPVVWGIQRDSGLIVKIDPTTGAILDSFAAPGGVSPNHLFAGLTIAEGGNSLLYINGHTGPTTLYRLDPQTGAVLSTELMPPAVNPTFRTGLSAEDAVLEFSPESGQATTTLIFGIDDGIGIDVQFGFGGPMTKQFVAGPTQFPGALGGDDNGRAFAVFEPNVVSEYSVTTPNQILNTFAAPTADDAAAGLAFDGVHLYIADLSGNLFTLDPDTGAVLNRVTVAGGGLIGLGAFREPVASEQALEDFEDGSLSEYTTVGSTAMRVEAIAAHDGQLGLVASNAPGWVYRDDAAAHVQQGDVFSVWVQTTGLSSSGGGRAYFGFGASGQGTYSVVMAPNSGQFLIQENVNFNFATLAAASQSWEAGKWYRIEVAWEQDGDIRARLYDSDGTTLLNSLAANDTTFTGGGIAFRAFGDTKYFDSVEKVGATAAGKDTVHPAAAIPGEPLDDGEAASDPAADDPTATLYVDPGNLPDLVDSPVDSDVGASPSAAGTEVIVNGGFESGDFAGWTLNNLGSGSWVVNNGSHDPPGPGTPLPPISGSFDALSSPGGPGTRTLSQAVTIPTGIVSATLSWSDRIRNHAGTFADPGQEFRVVVRDTSGGLIQEIFSTDPGDPAQQTGPNNRSFDVTSLLQSLAGQTVRISFEEQDSLFYFNVTLDNVSLMIEQDEPGGEMYAGVGRGSPVNPGAVLIVDQSTGAGTLLGDPVTPGGLTGLDFDSQGRLWGSSVDGPSGNRVSELVEIDSDTGAQLSSRPITFNGIPISIGDLAIQPGTDLIFGVHSNTDATAFPGGVIYTIDPSTGVATFVGDTQQGRNGGLAFASDGTLYFLEFGELHTLDPDNAAILNTAVLNFGGHDGLGIRPSDGVFFASRSGAGTLGDEIRIIDPVAGTSTLLGRTGVGNASDLAFRPAASEADTDAYLLDLSGKAGTSIDVVFDLEDSASGGTSAESSTLELIAPDGTTILATGAPAGDNFDLGILDFVVPADGIYTIRVSGSDARYTVLVTENLVFDTETTGSRTTIFSDDFESGSLGSQWSVSTASVPAVGTLQTVDALISGALPSTTVVGTFAQADFSDQAGPSNGRWAFNNAIPGNGGDDYAVVTTGTLQVNQSGWYSFAIGSDDGGRLRIDGFDVIVDNANHAFADRYGSRFLTAGTHTFEWVGMERHGGAGFEMSVALGFNRSAVAAANGWRVIGAPDAHAQIALSGVLSTTAYYPDPLPVSEGRVEVTSGRGTPTHGGLFHLAMDDRVANTIYSRNEAVLTVDLTDQTEVELSFWHKDIGDEELNSLGGADMPLSFVGSVIGDGVSISADGVTWHTVLDFNDSPDPNSVYTRHIIDLSAAARAAGIALGPNFRIKFQQYDDDPISIDGRTFDDIEITAAVPPEFRSIDGTGGALGFLGSGTGEVDLGLKQSFTAIPYTGWIPPDPIIAAGPEQLVGMVNGRVAIYDKDTGVTLFQQNLAGAGGFFGTVGATGSVFDPWVVFDPHSQRFFAIAVGVTNPLGTADDQCHVYLAVSTDSTPTSGNDWYKYRLDRTGDHRNLVNKTFADYLKLGVNEEGIFISANDFGIGGGGFSHVSLFAIEKQPLLSGGPVNIVYDENIFGAFSVHPLVVYDPGAPMYFAQSSTGSGNSIIVHTITDLLGTPTRTTSTVAVPSYAFPNDVPQQGGGAALDTMDARIMSGMVRDGSLWTAHSIRDPAVDAETVVRWYQFDVNGSPSLAQSGNVDPGPGLHTWMSHINVDADGDMGIAFSVAGPNQFASIGYTGRLASDPLGTTRPVEVARVGEGNYVRLDGIGRNRWGDYSGLAIDPDGETFWLFNEYATANNTWQTFVGAFEVDLDAPDVDFYTVTLASGDTVGFRTNTPFDNPLSGLNLLDPRIEIYDASGNLVASDSNGAADGRNAELSYRPAAGGVYTIVVATDEGSGDGEYVLSQFDVNDAPENVELVLSATEIDEDGMVTLTGTFEDPDPADTHTVVITWGDGESDTVPLNGERSFVLTHRYLDDDPSGTSSDVYTIGAVVTDAEGASDTAAAAVTVRNVAPEVSGLSLEEAVIDENGSVTLTGTFADPGTLDTHKIVIDWGDGTNVTVVDLTGGERIFSATHQYLDDDPTGTPSDVFTISVTVTDDDTGTDGESLSVRVNNLDPVITSIGNSAPVIGDAAEGVPVSVSAAFTDVGTLDTHSATIDWGDGTTSSAVITQGEGFGSLDASHAYQQGGVYTIVVTLRDDDTGEAVATTTAFVSGLGVHDGALQIVGTGGDDLVVVNAVDGNWLRVHASFLPDLGGWRDVASAGVELIQVFLGAGDDLFVLAGDIRTPLVVDAGAGNDHVQGGGGRSILIGGEGSDHLIGGSGEDILIAGTTAFDGEADALRALLIEWASSRSLEERVANLYDGTGTSDRENGDYFLTVGPDGTVDDDSEEDVLTGGADSDWFFFDPELDSASMLRNELFANDLDSVLS